MTTQKHLREEVTIDVAEPPRKKSKKSKTNGDYTVVPDPDVAIEATKKDKKDKKKDKKEKRKKEGKKDRKEKKSSGKKTDKNSGGKEVEAPILIVESTAEPSPVAESITEAQEQIVKTATEANVAAPDVSKEKKKTKGERDEKKRSKPKSSRINATSTSPDGDASLSGAAKISRNYTETKSLSAIPEAEISTFLTTHNIAVNNPAGFITYRPITAFMHLPRTTLVAKSPFQDFKEPTPIQAASWPYGLAGRDIVGIAETGSGKTMAFTLPCVEAVLATITAASSSRARQINDVTRALIVSPTRELAMQTHAQVARLCSLVGLSCVCLYGGSPKPEQREQLQKGAAVVVATPGRLKDFLNDGDVSLGRVSFAVLDEADRMLDKGFEEDIRTILGACPAKEKRQTVMFTATWPQSVQALASTFMTSPVKIMIGRGTSTNGGEDGDGERGGSGEIKLQANMRIKQEVFVVDHRSKEQRTLQTIRQAHAAGSSKDRILVFCLYKKEATRVENFLSQRGVKVCAIHGDLKQEQRTRSLDAFKAGRTSVLVATDVAARGLDIPEVKLVLNVTVCFFFLSLLRWPYFIQN